MPVLCLQEEEPAIGTWRLPVFKSAHYFVPHYWVEHQPERKQSVRFYLMSELAQGQFDMSTGLTVLPEFGSTLGKKYIADRTYPERTVQQY